MRYGRAKLSAKLMHSAHPPQSVSHLTHANGFTTQHLRERRLKPIHPFLRF